MTPGVKKSMMVHAPLSSFIYYVHISVIATYMYQSQNHDLPVKSEDGTITEETTKLEMLRMHFKKILNRLDSLIFPDINEADKGPIKLSEV